MRSLTGLRLLSGLSLLALSGVAAAQNAETTQSADVYAGPDNSYPIVAQLDADAPVQVMGCLNDWSWCDVSFGDTRGWLYSPDLVYDYQGGYVPFYTYAPSFGVPVVEFSIDTYWDRYYHGRPWYAQRAEWVHRPPPQHRRPPGPPPSAGPPPRSARVDHPPHGARPPREEPAHQGAGPHAGDRPVRLGEAHPRPESHAQQAEAHAQQAEPHAPPPHAPPPNAPPPHKPSHQEPSHQEPSHQEPSHQERPPQPQRAEAPRPEEPPRHQDEPH